VVALKAAIAVFIAIALAEWLHVRRCRPVQHLAFGATGHPRPWTAIAPFLRVLSMTALVWGLTILFGLKPHVRTKPRPSPDRFRRIVVALDVSPSMQLADAGPELDQRRSARCYDIMRSVMERILMDQVRFSIVGFYTGAQPAVIDTVDANVVDNVFNDLPLEYVFDHGKTELFAAFNEIADIAKDWPDNNATLIVLTDGDTVPATGMPKLPRSVSSVLIVGVGNPDRGIYIDGHESRQERQVLRQVARRLGGDYVDANRRHIPSERLRELSTPLSVERERLMQLREWALAAAIAGAIIVAAISPCLDAFGTHRLTERKPA